ncbi:kinase-like protein [Gonapodya prolifera JEL478]|uniref:1-phosphatidylinositol 4-kinase n=1 Tax=Gonapodya prolifera (strain JEL478) TaxID=1344416 RepID=A0A139A1S6_GONPJ|nr:kinase-like protein [Gonapodya prolifera JEL478]|eukprot:KXS10694.1 kinase-like protein [Gonapodya prolifera JEL478]
MFQLQFAPETETDLYSSGDKLGQFQKQVGTEIYSAIVSRPFHSLQSRFIGEAAANLHGSTAKAVDNQIQTLKNDFNAIAQSISRGTTAELSMRSRFERLLHCTAAFLVSTKKLDVELVSLFVRMPVTFQSTPILRAAVNSWTWLLNAFPESEGLVMHEIFTALEESIEKGLGLFGSKPPLASPFTTKMTMTAPAEKIHKVPPGVEEGHLLLLQVLTPRISSSDVRSMAQALVKKITDNPRKVTRSNRKAYFQLLRYCFGVAKEASGGGSPLSYDLIRYGALRLGLSWFADAPSWADSSQPSTITEELEIIRRVISAVQSLPPQTRPDSFTGPIYGSFETFNTTTTNLTELLSILIENERQRLLVWMNPQGEAAHPYANPGLEQVRWQALISAAATVDPSAIVHIPVRFSSKPAPKQEVAAFVESRPWDFVHLGDTLRFILDSKLRSGRGQLGLDARALLVFAPVSPVKAIHMLVGGKSSAPHPWITQYLIRVLEFYPSDVVFFYIPQVVQALRYDSKGYLEHFILETAYSSQLFAHQIVWNMKANMYRDFAGGEGKTEDVLKPRFEQIIEKIVKSFSVKDQDFYEREFRFFSEVTGISGKLKDFIKKPKEEKKKKIDEELRKIKVEPGVYLPSNPDAVVVDINYDSGRPLQSHAKAPYMATFKVKHRNIASKARSPTEVHLDDSEVENRAAIFKVGDDCRQDVLALQLIAIFKEIYASVGLEQLYVFPYRTVATAPGCGVIEVIPNASSRDQIGREQVNSLYDYFIAQYGVPDTLEFQRARSAFARSLAAYSIIMYILQIKDRHNGNLMFDKAGHILHIDFGFLFDIAPGGLPPPGFESSPFKLTTEFIQVLGGSPQAETYKWFVDMSIRGYLAARPYVDEIVQIVELMIESGLPCFKDATLPRLRSRFQPDMTERDAAQFMIERVKESHQNTRTVLYDEFQFRQNGIPYHR